MFLDRLDFTIWGFEPKFKVCFRDRFRVAIVGNVCDPEVHRSSLSAAHLLG
jgi:hypothetical protein